MKRLDWCPPFPDDLVLTPVSRWPTTLPSESKRAVLAAPAAARIRGVRRAADEPAIGIVVVTRDGLPFTRLCLESLLAAASAVPIEVVVVDNGSTDGTLAYLKEVEGLDARVRVHRNGWNAGFARATNIGVARSRGAIVLLLNNDTIVPAGVLERTIDWLSDEEIGLLGAVTNRAGNEAQIETSYRTVGELRRFAAAHVESHGGELFDIRTATMFFAAMRREVWNRVGPLDDRFGPGLFEDDDYAMRTRGLGYRVVCAEDVFVHHFGQASIGQLGPTGEYGQLFHTNRARWEAKWGTVWQPHERRERAGYRELVGRIHALVSSLVPLGATVAVISKGDSELIRLERRQAWHFPQGEDGNYAGHYPLDSAACIAELERMRDLGADFLIVPATARWWLRHYRQFGEHLAARYQQIVDDSSAAIFALAGAPSHWGRA